MKTQKDELQRQRDALQRQIDLFDDYRRRHLTTPEHRASTPTAAPDLLTRRSLSPATDHPPDELIAVSGSPGHQAGAAAKHRVLARVGSAGNVAALDGRAVTRFGSVGNLTVRRDSKALPLHLMSTTNESRLSAGSTSTLPSPSSVKQLIPAKLSSPAHNPPKTVKDQRGVVDVEKATSRAASVDKNASPAAGGAVGSRDPSRAAGTTSGNILPLKLAEGRREPSRSSSSSSSSSQYSSLQCSLPASYTAAGDDVDDECRSRAESKVVDDGETEILYF